MVPQPAKPKATTQELVKNSQKVRILPESRIGRSWLGRSRWPKRPIVYETGRSCVPTVHLRSDSSRLILTMKKDCLLKPVRVFPDPFRKLPNILVLCEVYNHEWSPIGTNHRYSCKKTMDKAADSKPWFGLEQEYTLLDHDGESFSLTIARVIHAKIDVLAPLKKSELRF